MSIKRLLLLVSFLLVNTIVSGQGYIRNWPIGINTTLEFTGAGYALASNSNPGGESLAAMSDANGNLLFYCIGDRVYNANHLLMPNGSGLNSHPSAFQGSIPIPFESDSNKYFIFQVEAGEVLGNYGFVYSVVDMTLEAGLGDIAANEKNIQISSQPTCEGIAATAHRTGEKVWVLMHNYNTNNFQLVLTGDTIDTIIEQASNTTYQSTGAIFKFSPNGKWFASSIVSDSLVELYSFNNESGTLAFVQNLNFPSRPLGVEFSSNSNQLYIACQSVEVSSEAHYLYQFGMESNSLLSLDTITRLEALQLDEERRIQLALTQQMSLGVIQSPNETGLNALPTDSFISIAPNFMASRFPNWVSNWFNTSFCIEQSCATDSAVFYFAGYKYDSLIWNFGNPTSGPLNHAEGIKVRHFYQDPGQYEVTLYATTGGHRDTLVKTVKIDSIITSPLFNDDSIAFCSVDSNILYVDSSYRSYHWNSGSQLPYSYVDTSGVYSVTIENACGIVTDSVHVSLDDPFQFDLGTDTSVCSDTIVLNRTGNDQLHYNWSTGDSISSISIVFVDGSSNPKRIAVTVQNECFEVTDSIEVSFLSKPTSSLPSDTSFCFGDRLALRYEPQIRTTYLWSDGSTGSTLLLDSGQTVWLKASNICGGFIDSIHIDVQPEITVDLGQDTILCPGERLELNAGFRGASYSWSPPVALSVRSDSLITVNYDDLILSGQTETTYEVLVTSGSCQKAFYRAIGVDSLCDATDCRLSIPNVFSPNSDGVNDRFDISSSCSNLSYDYRIYNRWGQLVYTGSDGAIMWDGRVNGAIASDGTYYYILHYSSEGLDQKLLQGSFVLIR